ncbi:MAG TPA: ATP-dependent DNA helicase [Candidatus Saccharimonadia bacterium]|jgi:DNA helicase-2/ATP-dependent DNA helicase PcrA
MDILSGLNPEQLKAVQHDTGPMLVVAGAGTGKTQVITRRIAYLIKQGKAKPGQILALTFTEKAAREMEERLYESIGWESFQVPVMTFHAFGTELLGRFAPHGGRSIRGGLLNETQKSLLLQQHMDRVKLQYYGPQTDLFEFIQGIVGYIGALQNAGVTVTDYERYVAGLQKDRGDMHPRDVDEQADLCALYRLYETVKAETGTFDYNDQLYLPLEILRERPNLAERLAQEYRYVLVDEYQDTNGVQDALLRTFVGSSGNLFAVGDDDQAIYGFRGAEIGNILEFAKHFELIEPVVLTRNYRSGQKILDASYRLIQNNNPERLEVKLGINKRLVALHDESTAEYVPYHMPQDELQGVVKEIGERITGGEKPSGVAVLAATHAPLKAVAKALRARGLPFALSTTVNIFEQPELLGLWYLLKWLCLQASEEAVGHVLMGPYIGWTAEEYRRVLEISKEQMVSVEEALRSDSNTASREVCAKLDEWRSWVQDRPASEVAFKLVFDTGQADRWRELAQDSRRMLRVFEDLQKLLEHMQDYETVAIDTALVSYMTVFPKPPELEVNEPVGENEGVQLLTVHASKGLEFETVYLIGCTQRSWSGGHRLGREVPEPLRRSLDLPPEHELRRLMYVAVTRAKRKLYVSAASHTSGGSKQTVSPFVAELFGEAANKQAEMSNTPEDVKKLVLKLQQFYPLRTATMKVNLPFEDSEGWLDLSVTALNQYERCPFEFYIQHVLQIRQPLGPQIAFGNVLHKTFEQYYRGILNSDKRPGAELHTLLDELWNDRGYRTRDEAEADLQLAHRTLDRFLVREQQMQHRILGSEVPIHFELPEAKLRLHGKIDAYYATEEGLELRDFKTGRSKTDPEKLAAEAKKNLQLRTYALAYEMLKGVTPAKVVLDYVVTETEGAATLSPVMMKRHREKLAEFATRIRNQEFAPDPSPFHQCAAIKYYGIGEQEELREELIRQKEML